MGTVAQADTVPSVPDVSLNLILEALPLTTEPAVIANFRVILPQTCFCYRTLVFVTAGLFLLPQTELPGSFYRRTVGFTADQLLVCGKMKALR